MFNTQNTHIYHRVGAMAHPFRGGFWLILCITLLGQTRVVHAEDALTSGLDPELAVKLRQTGDIVLEDLSLAQAMFAINETWDINIVVSSSVQGQITGVFRDAPLYEILDSILLANGYGYRPLGKSLVIMPLDGQVDLNPMFETATIALRAANPDELLTGARLLISPRGHVESIASARSLLVIDFPERVELIRNFANQIDTASISSSSPSSPSGGGVGSLDPLQVSYFAPQYINAIDIKESVQSLLSPEGRVSVVEPENRLVVYDFPLQLGLVQDLILQLDVPRPQVRITSLIYDVSLGDMEAIGLNWNHALRGGETNADDKPALLWAIDSLQQIPTASSLPGAAMTLATMNQDFDLTVAMQLLRQCDDSRLLADPSVIVTDREPALMQIVTEIPFQQLTQTSQGGNIGSTGFREAGVTLNVTPYMSNDGTILMNIRPTFSRLTGFTKGESPQPIIDRREAQTMVRVEDRRTFVLGGLRQRTEVGTFRRVPGLGDIEHFGIGKLFRSREETVRESELIVFIRPEIVTPYYEGNPREQAAIGANDCLLERIPYATPSRCSWGCSDRTDPGCSLITRPYPCCGSSYPGEGQDIYLEPLEELPPPMPASPEQLESSMNNAPPSPAQSPQACYPSPTEQASLNQNSEETPPMASVLHRIPSPFSQGGIEECPPQPVHIEVRDPAPEGLMTNRVNASYAEQRSATQWLSDMFQFR